MPSFAVVCLLFLNVLYRCNSYCRYEEPIGFSAQLSSDVYIKNGRFVVFDKTTVNNENGYNVKTGEFKAPMSGLYVFTFTISTRDWRVAQLLLNNIPKSYAMADTLKENGGERSTASNTVLLRVKKGDSVRIQITHGGSKLSGRYSSFSGYLI